MKNSEPKQQVIKWQAYVTCVGVIVLVQLIVSLVLMYVSNPTPEHVKVQNELIALQANADNAGGFDALSRSKEYQTLVNSAEYQYSTLASTLGAVVTMAVRVTLLYKSYMYLRKNFGGNHLILVVAIIAVASTLIGYGIGEVRARIPVLNQIAYPDSYTLSTGSADAVMIGLNIGFFIISLLFTAAIAALIARFAQTRYDRKYGFEI